MSLIGSTKAWYSRLAAIVALVLVVAIAGCSPVVAPLDVADTDVAETEVTEPPVLEPDVEADVEVDAGPDATTLAGLVGESTGETYRGLPVGFTADGRMFRGDPDAALVMIEYSDFQCPFCNRYFVQTEPALDEAFVRSGDVMVVFHDFPLAQLHPLALQAHAALLCVADQGSAATAWQMRGELFRSVNEWGSSANPAAVYVRLAEEVGSDADAVADCLAAGTFDDEVQARVAAAMGQGFSGTPSFQFVRRDDAGVFQLIGAQPYDSFAELMELLLAGESPQMAQAESGPPADDSPPFWATPQGLVPDPDRPGYNVAGDIYRGNPDARVAVIEFSDFQCPFCRRHIEDTQPTLDELYVDTGEVLWVFKHFPLNIHPQAPLAGAAAECAADQGLFWEMHHLLFETVSRWAVSDHQTALLEIANELPLDQAVFEACLTGGEALARVESDLADGAPFVRGTPTFIVLYNGQGNIIPGALPLETFIEVMDEILAEAQ